MSLETLTLLLLIAIFAGLMLIIWLVRPQRNNLRERGEKGRRTGGQALDSGSMVDRRHADASSNLAARNNPPLVGFDRPDMQEQDSPTSDGNSILGRPSLYSEKGARRGTGQPALIPALAAPLRAIYENGHVAEKLSAQARNASDANNRDVRHRIAASRPCGDNSIQGYRSPKQLERTADGPFATTADDARPDRSSVLKSSNPNAGIAQTFPGGRW